VSADGFDFAKLYLELVDSTQMISALLAGISMEDAQVRPDPASWSILETVCHLYDEERLDFRARLDALLHRPETQWEPIDPEGWVSSRRYNEQVLGDVKERFFAERSKSLDWLKGLEKADWALTHVASFGTIAAGDMFASWVAHDNLAIRQLVELRRARLETITKPYKIDYAGEW
jgi:DinB superfamily